LTDDHSIRTLLLVAHSSTHHAPSGRHAGIAAKRPPGRPPLAQGVDEHAFLEAALHAFALHGYDAVSVRELSREQGVSHGWVNERFGSKLGLWHAAVDHGFRPQASVVTFDPTLTDPLEQLEHGIRQFLLYSAEHPELLLVMNTEGAHDGQRLDYIHENYIAPVLNPFGRLVNHLIEQRRIRPVAARTFFLLLAHGATAPFGLVALAAKLDSTDPRSGQTLEDHIENVTRILIDGLRTGR
jgi:AcrR family transcriptional regulator